MLRIRVRSTAVDSLSRVVTTTLSAAQARTERERAVPAELGLSLVADLAGAERPTRSI